VTRELLAQWDVLPNSSEVDVSAAMMRTTLHIISRTMFSANSDEIVEVVERDVKQYQTAVRPHLLDLLGFPVCFTSLFSHRQRAVAAFDEFDSMVDQLINDRACKPNNKQTDLLARLVAARDIETGGGMTAKEVRDEVVTIFMAGQETTAQALTWTWYLLSLHPWVEAKLHEELITVLNGRTPQYEDIANLRYARMVIEESMRLYPPAHTMAREPISPDYILGHRIPAGALVLIVPWLLHRKASLWDQPHRFNPDRFMTEPARFTYIRSGSAHLHWRDLCNDRSDFDPSNGCSILSATSQDRPSHRTARLHHLAAALRNANDPRTTAITAKVKYG
jgi:cytochrome P450